MDLNQQNNFYLRSSSIRYYEQDIDETTPFIVNCLFIIFFGKLYYDMLR